MVTGGHRGLGKALVEELLSAALPRSTPRHGNSSDHDDPRVVSIALDVTDAGIGCRPRRHGPDATIVINNAGAHGAHRLLSSHIDDIRAVFETNYFGAVRVAQAFAPVLAPNGGGALVDIHSVLSWVGGIGGYGDSKAAIWSATNSLRIELDPQDTFVTGVHVAYIDTDMVADFDVPKNDPRQVARDIVDGIEHGDTEVLADDFTRQVKSALAGPVEALQLR